ncbi:MAG: hypothetical protein KF760_27190 [Candidatus Eremiobacteraeota bacterium]|nr:hypothetical protein [Candidatus Eremiobacteraeota bacterium]MCW5872526.1 hypothetical protein [Candidatus Eremiobacteraeota bacterium]
MGQSSELEDLLRAEVGEGVKDSSGRFTISREKALEKLAAFRLASETAWVLKIVQAAVASSCTELDIRQTSTGTEFHFSGETGWTLAQVEAEFYQVEAVSETSLEHLKQGLWSVSLNGMRPFSMVAPDWPEALLWTGDKMLRKPVKPVSRMVLTISHRSMVEGRRFSLIPDFEAASRNAEIARELAEQAFVCSKPLRLDNRRLDSLQLCPRHGLSSSSYPVQLGFLRGDLPALGLPPATVGGFTAPKEVDPSMRKLLHPEVTIPQRLALACMVTAHLRKVARDKALVWKAYEEECLIYWVRDGVVVDRTRPRLVSAGCCSLALFASAEGLSADAGGFVLQKNEAFRQREEEVCRLGASFLGEVRLNMTSVVEDARRNARLLGGLIAVGGLGYSFFSIVHGAAITVMGVYKAVTAGGDEIQISAQVDAGMRGLQRDWATHYAQAGRDL